MYRFKVFIATMLLTFLGFGFIYGIGKVYVNCRNAYYPEHISVVEINRTSYNKAELKLVGKTYEFDINHTINATEYTLIPPIIRLIFIGFHYLDEYLEENFNIPK